MLSLGGWNSLLGAFEGASEVATTNSIDGSTGAVVASQVLYGAVVGRSAGGVRIGDPTG